LSLSQSDGIEVQGLIRLFNCHCELP